MNLFDPLFFLDVSIVSLAALVTILWITDSILYPLGIEYIAMLSSISRIESVR